MKLIYPEQPTFKPNTKNEFAYTKVPVIDKTTNSHFTIDVVYNNAYGFSFAYDKYTAGISLEGNELVFDILKDWYVDFQKVVKQRFKSKNPSFKPLINKNGKLYVSWDRVYVDGVVSFREICGMKPDSERLKSESFTFVVEPRVWARIDQGESATEYGVNFVVVDIVC